MYIYIYTYTYACTCMYVCIYIYICIRIYIYIYVFTRARACTRRGPRTCAQRCPASADAEERGARYMYVCIRIIITIILLLIINSNNNKSNNNIIIVIMICHRSCGWQHDARPRQLILCITVTVCTVLCNMSMIKLYYYSNRISLYISYYDNRIFKI